MLHVHENGIRGEIIRAIKNYTKANSKYVNNFNPSFIIYLYFNNHYRDDLSKPVPYSGFEWAEDTAMFTKIFIKNYNK